jgi:hypothetical protein
MKRQMEAQAMNKILICLSFTLLFCGVAAVVAVGAKQWVATTFAPMSAALHSSIGH